MRRSVIFLTSILVFVPLTIFGSVKKDLVRKLYEWQIPGDLSHPRLYFNSDGLRKLQLQYQSGCPRVRKFLSGCDSLVARPLPDYSDYNSSRYAARSESEKLAFAYAITQKDEYATYAKCIIRQMVHWSDWVYEEHKPLRVDLGVAGAAYVLAFCYDWLYPALSITDREEIETAVFNKALIPFRGVYAAKSEEWTRVEHNWRSVICGEMGIVALTFLEKDSNLKESLKFAIDGVVDVFSAGGEDGGWNEGVSYWGFGIGQAMMFVEALHHVSAGAVDLYELPFLQVTGNFGMYIRTPGGESFNFSDCNPGPPEPWIMALLASHYRNPFWQWSAIKDFGSAIPDILFYDPAFEPKKPVDLALGAHFKGIQVAAMRSSWEDDAIFIGLKTGRTTANHSHLDLNSFVLHAYGRPLLIDQHNWPYAHYLGFFDFNNRRWDFEGNHSIAHNTLLIDGQGQGYGKAFEGRIINFSTTPELQFAVGEANAAYGDLIAQFHRYLVLVDDKCVVIVDDVRANGLRKMEWLMHYAGQIEEDSSGIFNISNGTVQLSVQFLRPAKPDNRVVNFERHETSYKATRQTTTQINRFVSVRPLHKQSAYRFIAAAFPEKVGEQSTHSAQIESESEEELALMITVNGISCRLAFDFRVQAVRL